MRVEAGGVDKLSGTEYGDDYTSHWVIEVTGNTLVKVRSVPRHVTTLCR